MFGGDIGDRVRSRRELLKMFGEDIGDRVCSRRELLKMFGGDVGDRVRSRRVLETPRRSCPAEISGITSVVAVLLNRRGRAVRRRYWRSRP